MKKSISLLLAAVMVFALAAIACADATTLTAWITDGAETVVYTSMFDDFNSKHDDIKVDYQFFAQDELLNKLQTAPIVGDTPDLIVIDGDPVADISVMNQEPVHVLKNGVKVTV